MRLDTGSLLARFQHTQISIGDVGTKTYSEVLPVLLYYLENGVVHINNVAKPVKKSAAKSATSSKAVYEHENSAMVFGGFTEDVPIEYVSGPEGHKPQAYWD